MTSPFGEDEEDHFDTGATLDASQLIALYVQHMRNAERPRTHKHISDVRRKMSNVFVKAEEAGTPIQRWGKNAMKAHIRGRREAGLSDTTIRQDVVCAKALLHWLYVERYFDKDLLKDFPLPGIAKEVSDKTAADKDSIDMWFLANREYYRDTRIHGKKAIERGWTRQFMLRDQLFVCLLVDTAIRPAEATRIMMNQIKTDDMGTFVDLTPNQTKSKVARKIYLSAETVKFALDPWLNCRSEIKFDGADQGYLLCSSKTDRNGDQSLDASTWGRQFRKKVAYGKAPIRSERQAPNTLRIEPI